MRDPMSLQASIKESNRCLLCHDAPCSQACPAGTDPAKFIRQIKFLNYKGAARTIRNNNILGTVCSFICPVEKLCEKACSIKALEDPIDIRGLQCFAAEYGNRFKLEPQEKSLKTKAKIAVIGCGPAGMSCAAELAKMDYDVTIFEREAKSGGVGRWNIPDFRLPGSAIDQDFQNLQNLGVEIKFNSAIDAGDSISVLLAEGFEAIFIGCGLSSPFTLKMFEGFTNTYDYNSFLRMVKVNRESLQLQDKSVVVIGGGSVAIDSAVSAKACGAAKVYLVFLESLEELPADQEEIELARTMGILFRPASQVSAVISDGNRITGLTGCEIEWLEPGKFVPSNATQVPGTEFSLKADVVIQAIGTSPGKEVSQLSKGMKTSGKGVIRVGETFETSIPGLFAGGDVVNGGATVVQAVGEGKKAAVAIDHYLTGRKAI